MSMSMTIVNIAKKVLIKKIPVLLIVIFMNLFNFSLSGRGKNNVCNSLKTVVTTPYDMNLNYHNRVETPTISHLIHNIPFQYTILI